jgi:hypothetical protein
METIVKTKAGFLTITAINQDKVNDVAKTMEQCYKIQLREEARKQNDRRNKR